MSILSQPPSAKEKPDLAYIEFVADDQCKGPDGKVEGTLKLAEQQLLSEGRPRWEVIKDNKRAMLVIMIMLVAIVVGGTDGTVANALVGSQSFCKMMGAGYKNASGVYAIPPKTNTIWNAVNTPFQVISVPVAGWLIDRIGRKYTMGIGLLIYIVAGAAQIGAQDWRSYCVAKMCYGAAGGFSQTASVTYVSEVAPREIRGAFLAVVPLMTTLGIFLAAFITYYCNLHWPTVDSKLGYQVPMIVVLILPVLILVLQFFTVIETPYYLLLRGKAEHAKRNMRRLYPGRSEADYALQLAEYEYILLKEAEQKELEKGTTFLDCLKGTDLRRTFCAVLPQASQSFCGQSLIATQATYFFTLAGQKNSLKSTTISHGIGVAAYFFTAGLLEVPWLGRFRMLISGQVIMGSAMFILGAVTTRYALPYPASVADVILFCICLGVFGAAVGPGAAGWAYIGESSSARLRGKTAMYGVLGNTLIGACFTTAIPYMLVDPVSGGKGGLGVNGVGFWFAAWATVMVAATVLTIPDYTGLSYAQIDELFARKVPARRFRSTETTGDYGRDITQRSEFVDGPRGPHLVDTANGR